MSSAIHPAPAEFTEQQLLNDQILRYFHYAHLPAVLQTVSKPFCDLARMIVTNLPRNPERTVALRKLLEAKDAAVRANLPEPVKKPDMGIPMSDEPVEIQNADIDRDGPVPFS